MEKKGFYRIGYLHNPSEFRQQIKNLTGEVYFDYNSFDDYIDTQWDNRINTVLCYDQNRLEVSSSSNDIFIILIDIGYKKKGSIEPLYARFSRKSPNSLDAGEWFGVKLGTKAELLEDGNIEDTDLNGDSFDAFSSVPDYGPISWALNKKTGKDFGTEECKKLIRKSFATAKENDMLTEIEHKYDADKNISFFPLTDCVAPNGQKIFVKMEKNKIEGMKKWYGAFVITEEDLKDELLSFFLFHVGNFHFDSVVEANAFFSDVAQKAMKEKWSWTDPSRNTLFKLPILKSYLEHTYYRLLDEDKLVTDDEKKKRVSFDGKCYFNSGLLDKNFRQIIIVGEEETLEKDIKGLGTCTWHLLSNLKAYTHNDIAIARMFREDDLPRMASYFENYSQIVFNARLDIHTHDNHVFEDGVERGRLPKYQEEYEKVKNTPAEKELLITRIARDFDSARDRAKLMAERNYKLAVPQFWRETGEIQFLLPIYLGEREEAEKPQCALVLSLDQSGRQPYYRGSTIITLDMAYNNTRLIAKPDVFWLNDLV